MRKCVRIKRKGNKTDSKKKEKIIVKAKETDGEKAKFDCPKCDERLECESKWRHHISNSHGNMEGLKKNGGNAELHLRHQKLLKNHFKSHLFIFIFVIFTKEAKRTNFAKDSAIFSGF